MDTFDVMTGEGMARAYAARTAERLAGQNGPSTGCAALDRLLDYLRPGLLTAVAGFDAGDVTGVTLAMARSAGRVLYVDAEGLAVAFEHAIHGTIRRAVSLAGRPPEVVVVERFEALRPRWPGDTRRDAMGAAVRGLRRAAKAYALHALLAVRLDPPAAGPAARPTPADLGDAEGCGLDADALVLVRRPAPGGRVELHVARNRGGPTGSVVYGG